MVGISPLVRVSKTPEVVAKNFGAWCKKNYIITRNFVRIGYNKENGRRGLIAAKSIPKDETIVHVPSMAMMNFTWGMKDQTFTSMFLQKNLPLPITPENVQEKMRGSFVHRSHMVLAMYMVHGQLSQEYERHDWMAYIDFLPRGESGFLRLSQMLLNMLEADDECQSWCRAIGARHHVTREDVRDMLVYFLSMIFSRSLPIDHFVTVGKLLEGSDFLESLKKDHQLAVSCMCPVLDMCNHHPLENAAVMVPDTEMKNMRVVCLRSTRPIEVGEEVVMTYGGGRLEELDLIYGIEQAK